MKNSCLTYILIISFVFLTGCAGNKQILDYVTKDTLENNGLVNLALANNGAKVMVTEDNSDHPASTLINGITSSENWDQGEGWEYEYNGEVSTELEQSMQQNQTYSQSQIYSNETTDQNDSLSYGIRIQTNNGMTAPMGWVTIEFPEKKTVNRMVIYTIDSKKYPAGNFGVSHLVLQYWTEASLESEVTGWKVIDRTGKFRGQTGNSVRNNKDGIIPIRFQPVKTQRMRLAIWWTNNSKLHSRQYITGTIRLVEVEVYGYESEKSKNVETVSATAVNNDNEIAEIKVLLDTYTEGYNKKDIDILMSSISPEYSKDGETYLDLKKRIASIFTKNGQIKLELQDIKIKIADSGATATAHYESSIDTSTNTPVSGILTFNISKATGFWKITRIDT
jgi:hypothetical protein